MLSRARDGNTATCGGIVYYVVGKLCLFIKLIHKVTAHKSSFGKSESLKVISEIVFFSHSDSKPKSPLLLKERVAWH